MGLPPDAETWCCMTSTQRVDLLRLESRFAIPVPGEIPDMTINNHVRFEVIDQFIYVLDYDGVRYQVLDQVRSQVLTQVWIQVSSQVLNQVWDQVWNQVSSQIWNHLDEY